jgi:signal transduction histidine kinase
MRWWLGLVFAAIAALTALSVAELSNHRAESALRQRAADLAVGQTVSAAQAVQTAEIHGFLTDAATLIAERRRFSLFVFSANGTLLTDETSRGVHFKSVPEGQRALHTALRGGRFVANVGGGQSFVVALRVGPDRGAIVTFTPRPELVTEFVVVHDEILRAALLAVAIGAVVGLLVAALITARLRRIGRAAARIESGAFDEPLPHSFGDELGTLAATIDQMRERLRDSFGRLGDERDRLRQVLEGLQEGVVAVDRDLRVTFANRVARTVLPPRAIRVDAELGEPWPDFPLRAFAERLFAPGPRQATQERVVAGERTFALIGIHARADADAILVISDISEQERRERAEREFVANAAHELGTPLTAIAASLEVLQGGAKDDPEERDRFLELIERQTSRLSRLRRALLTLARAQTRQETLRLEPVAARTLLLAIADELAAAHPERTFTVDAPEDLAVLAHADLIEQVVLNLAHNAVDHGGAGRVELTAHAVGSRRAAIEVRDDGSGVPAADRDRLFDRFYRGAGRDSGGFGLGLAIVREAVDALGGTVELVSPPGGGTVAVVTLGRAEARVA